MDSASSKGSFGYTGTILRIDLSSQKIEKQKLDDYFYRKYMGGGAIGTYFLLKEAPVDIDAFDSRNILTIAPGVTTGAKVSGASRCCVTSISPVTGLIGDGQAGGSIGPAIKRAGYDAIVITGASEKPSYLFVNGDEIEIRDASSLTGKSVLEVNDILNEELGSSNLCIIQCGPAGEKKVRFACLLAGLSDTVGRTGMGAVLGGKNLRAVAVKGADEINFSNRSGLLELNKLAAKRLPDAGFPDTLRKYGTPGVVGFQAEAGNLATRNHSKSFHKDYMKLDGSTFESEIGSGSSTCMGCVVKCRKKVKTEKPYRVTDRLGGPEFETLSLLGSNLEITDPVAVAKANELCNNYGMDTITMGGLSAYIFECMEKGLIKPEQMEGKSLKFGDADGLLWLIEQTGNRTGVGETLAEGFRACIEKFGENTAPYAINVKGQGLAVHMAQVKPSQALMYSVCPIGPDHQSSEHDWLLASQSDDSKGLGIIEHGDAASADMAKVQMTAYSQYYYSLLDTLCLCMFCWGPGNLFSYRELEDLIQFTTGWKTSMWELMKVGERRINMMRQFNARRGSTREDDKLPDRLYEPLPDGPAKGKHVDRESHDKMLDLYYGLMGWDPESGNPSRGKLFELGLEWTI